MTGSGENKNGICGLLETYYPRLVAYACHFVHEEGIAEDIVQDAFYNFFRKYKSIPSDEFPPVIFRIVRNCCINWIKHYDNVEKIMISGPVKGEMLYNFDFLSQETDGDYLYEELVKQVGMVLDRLPARCREVFEMSRFKHMSNDEIADKLGISAKTVKNHMTRALSDFRKYLSKDCFLLLLFFYISHS